MNSLCFSEPWCMRARVDEVSRASLQRRLQHSVIAIEINATKTKQEQMRAARVRKIHGFRPAVQGCAELSRPSCFAASTASGRLCAPPYLSNWSVASEDHGARRIRARRSCEANCVCPPICLWGRVGRRRPRGGRRRPPRWSSLHLKLGGSPWQGSLRAAPVAAVDHPSTPRHRVQCWDTATWQRPSSAKLGCAPIH